MIKFIFGCALILYGFYKTLAVDPVWGLYLFVALTHIRLVQLGENIPLPLNIPIMVASLTLVLYLASKSYGRKFTNWPPESWLMAFMVLGMAISSSCADLRPDVGWEITLQYLKYWVFFVLFVNMLDSYEKVEWFHRVMILSAGWLVYRCWDLRGTTGARFENVGGDVIADANHYAAALVLLLPFVFQKTMSRSKPVAAGAAVLCFGVITAVFISGSRGGMLGIAAVTLLLLVNFKTHRKRVLCTALAVWAVALFFMNDYQKERLGEIFAAASQETRDSSAQGRVEFWGLAFQLFREHPVTGVGPGNFPYHSGYRIEGKEVGTPGHVTHSIWFESLSEGGLLVTLPFLLLLFRFYRNIRGAARELHSRDRGDAAVYVITAGVALGAFLVTATFLNRMIYEPIYWCIGLGVIHRRLLQLEVKEPEPLEEGNPYGHEQDGRDLVPRRLRHLERGAGR